MITGNRKILSGVLLLILGGTMVVTSVVFSLRDIVNGKFDQLFSFPISLSTLVHEKTAGSFTVPSRTMLSLWLRVPDCRIENKDFQLSVRIVDEAAGELVLWKNSFSNNMIHNNDADGQYYLLGIHYFNNNFSGKINYFEKGTWIAPYNGFLVIRKPKMFSMPVEKIAFLISGAALLVLAGIVLKQRNDIA